MLTTEGNNGGSPVYKVTPSRWEGESLTIRRDDIPYDGFPGDYYVSLRSGNTSKGTYFTDEEFEELFLAWLHIRWENDYGES